MSHLAECGTKSAERRFVAALIVAVAVWALRDLVVGPSLNEDGLRDLLTASRIASAGEFPAVGPGVHGTYYGYLGPLYYLFLAVPLALHLSVGALCTWVFVAHVGQTLAVGWLAWSMSRGVAWIVVLSLLALGGYTEAFHLEHESFVLGPVALSAHAALRHDRVGSRVALVAAFFWAGVAVQFQSIAALTLLTVAGFRWNSSRTVSAPEVGVALVAWTAPFALALLSPATWNPARPSELPWLLHQSLVPLVSWVVVIAALGRQALAFSKLSALAVALAIALVPPLVAQHHPSADGSIILRYFTYEFPLVTANMRSDNPEQTSIFAWVLLLLLPLVVGFRRALSADGSSARLFNTLQVGLLFGTSPGAIIFALHPSARFLTPFALWPILALAILAADLLARLARPRLVFAVITFIALHVLGSHHVVGLWHSEKSPRRPLALDTRSAQGLAARLAVRPDTLIGRLHGLDACGRPFAGFSLPSRVLAAFEARRDRAPTMGDGSHFVFDASAPCVPHDRHRSTPRRYSPSLNYDTARIVGVPGARLPLLIGYCALIIPEQPSPPFDVHGGCLYDLHSVRVTIAHDGRALVGRVPFVDVLVENLDGNLETPFFRNRAGPCSVTLTQGGVVREGSVRQRGNPTVVRFALAPDQGQTTLEVTANCPDLRTLDLWDAAP